MLETFVLLNIILEPGILFSGSKLKIKAFIQNRNLFYQYKLLLSLLINLTHPCIIKSIDSVW